MQKGLGRRIPPDFEHVLRYSYSPGSIVAQVETELPLPSWHTSHDQGHEGACVGFGSSMTMSIINDMQCRAQGMSGFCRYNPWWLWNEAKLTDVWPDTNPGDTNGTSVRAAMEVLRNQGHVMWDGRDETKGVVLTPLKTAGIQATRWAQSIDEMRTAISQGLPIAIGVNWYRNFGRPVLKNNEWWIGEGDFGIQTGGHCVCIYGASDVRQAFRVKNSWGPEFPEVYLSYASMQRLLNEQGEAALITDV